MLGLRLALGLGVGSPFGSSARALKRSRLRPSAARSCKPNLLRARVRARVRLGLGLGLGLGLELGLGLGLG